VRLRAAASYEKSRTRHKTWTGTAPPPIRRLTLARAIPETSEQPQQCAVSNSSHVDHPLKDLNVETRLDPNNMLGPNGARLGHVDYTHKCLIDDGSVLRRLS